MAPLLQQPRHDEGVAAVVAWPGEHQRRGASAVQHSFCQRRRGGAGALHQWRFRIRMALLDGAQGLAEQNGVGHDEDFSRRW